MRVIVTGASGQLGTDIVLRLRRCGHTAIETDMNDLDITRRQDVVSFFRAQQADAVIHCAAYTNVDGAESDVLTARNVNGYGTQNVAIAAELCGMRMLYVSSDYVFDGSGCEPIGEETEPKPLNVYGWSKFAGETAAQNACSRLFIVRTSWLFGAHGANFVRTMLRLSETNETLRVVVDQIGSPTFTEDLAVLLCRMIETERYGTYHVTNEGECSWFIFAHEIFRMAARKTRVLPVTSAEYPTVAERPKNSRLSKKKLCDAGFDPLPAWQDALERYLLNQA